MKRILLISDLPPCSNYTGGLMVSQLSNMICDENIELHMFIPFDSRLQPEFDEYILKQVKYTFYERPIEDFENNKDYKIFESKVDELSRLLLNYYRDYVITDVWCIVQGNLLCNLIDYLYRKTKCNYILQIWDPIEWWIDSHKFNIKLENKTKKLFDDIVRNAKKVITTSNQMSEYYLNKYNSHCIEVMPPIENHSYEISDKDVSKFIIGISGQIYANKEFDELVCALEKLNWKINNKDVEIHHYGLWNQDYLNVEKHKKYLNKIKQMGFLRQDILLYELSKLDMLYCPYFFSEDLISKKVSMLSFPSKLVTYLSIDVPTLVHAPYYAAPVKFCEKYNCAYVLKNNDINSIVSFFKEQINDKTSKKYIENSKSAVEENFSYKVVKKNFLKAFNVNYDINSLKLNILEVNNVDLSGRRFNGYDLMEYFNSNTKHRVKQIVSYKSSDNNNVINFYNKTTDLYSEWDLISEEKNVLSVLNQLSLTGSILKNKREFINADLVHYHLIHNTKLSIPEFADIVSLKPSVITIHDPWFMTGRCAYPINCEKWKTGCKNCEHLNNLFPLKYDNCSSLWKQKGKIFNQLDADIIISTPFMQDMINNCPITKNLNNVHIIPFGIDLDMFNLNESQSFCKNYFDIQDDEIVLFFRSQRAMKGTEFIVEALEKLNTDKKITLLSCDEVGNLDDLKDRYRVIELGNINNKEMIYAYKACDIFLMPSKGESFGLMAIEAMASSRPIIVFNNTALPYVTFAPECGKLVKDQDSDDLKNAIEELINDEKERLRRGKLGRELAEKHYDIDKYHKEITEVYEQAYKRQITKKIKNLYNSIDFENSNVKKLQIKLSIIAKRLVPIDDIPKEFRVTGKLVNNDKIDYSDDNVMGLIKRFNSFFYDYYKSKLVKECYTVYPVIPPKGLEKFIKNTPVLQKVARILKRKYVNIFCNKKVTKTDLRINQLENRINELEEKLFSEMKRGDNLDLIVKSLQESINSDYSDKND